MNSFPEPFIAVYFLQVREIIMKIKNIEGLSALDLQEAVEQGGRFVYFAFTVSFIFVTFRDTSDVYLVRTGDAVIPRGYIFSIVTFLLGWWGIPWGPKYTIEALRTNLKGGKDVTQEVMAVVKRFTLTPKNDQTKRA